MNNPIDHQAVGARIKSGRKNARLTQADLCKKIGVSAGAVSQWESGAPIEYKADNILRLATVLEVSPYKLLYNDDNQQQSNSNLNERAVSFALKVINTIDPNVREAQGEAWCSSVFTKAYNIYMIAPDPDKSPPDIELLTALLV